jgi:hypothetical protein
MVGDGSVPYKKKGTSESFEEYLACVKKAEILQISGKKSHSKKKESEEILAELVKEVQDIQKALNAAREKEREERLIFEEISSLVRDKATEYSQEKEKRDNKALAYHSTIHHSTLLRDSKNRLSNKPWPKPSNFSTLGNNQLTIRVLGDIHGWAPGLLSFLIQNDLADFSLNGEICKSVKRLSSQFPNPFDYDSDRVFIEGPWFDGSPFITPGDSREIFRGQVNTIDITPTKKLITDSIFIQVGDLIDRGDYSELTLETMRQLILKSPGCTLSLVGNHEGFLIEKNFRGWLKNERKTCFDRTKNRAGSIRLDPKRAGSRLTEAEFLDNVFSSYSAHYAHLLLTQEYRLRMSLDDSSRDRLKSLTQPSLDLVGIDDSELEEIANSNEWRFIQRSLSWLNAVREEKSSVTLAGAICMFSVGNSVFLHSESNALLKVTDEDWLEFREPFKTKNGAEYRMLFYATGESLEDKKVKSRHYPLLWSRSKTRWLLGEISDELNEAAEFLNNRLPWISRIYHGHSAIKKIYSLDVKLNNQRTIKISNLDWSWTPPYLSDGGDKNPYSVEREVQFETQLSIGRTPLHTKVRVLNNSAVATSFIEGESKGEILLNRNIIGKFVSKFSLTPDDGKRKETLVRVNKNCNIVEYTEHEKIEHGSEFKGVLGERKVLLINQQKQERYSKIMDLIFNTPGYDDPIAIIYDTNDTKFIERINKRIIDKRKAANDERKKAENEARRAREAALEAKKEEAREAALEAQKEEARQAKRIEQQKKKEAEDLVEAIKEVGEKDEKEGRLDE